MEFILLALFSASLLFCVYSKVSILVALLFGYFLFFGYGIGKNKSFKEMIDFSLKGVKSVKNILITFILIGVITAVWRASGSIAYIVYHASALARPSIMVVLTFLLSSLISFLTGTAFGSAATIGVICATMANTMDIPILYIGGAVLSGVYFGDRCSFVSTSALLVSELTKTDLFINVKKMFKTALIPFLITVFIYYYLGKNISDIGLSDNSRNIFKEYYNLSILTILPVVIVLLFSFLRINVKKTLACSSLVGIIISVYLQNIAWEEIPKLCLMGFKSNWQSLNSLMEGGGIVSMIKVFLIVCISSSYSGIFKGTGFLNKIEYIINKLNEKISPFGTIVVTSIVSGAIACNQTLTILLTHQICDESNKDKEKFAIYLENSAVLIAALIPWSIASGVPLLSVGAPLESIKFAFYLYLVPLYRLIINLYEYKKSTY